MFTFQHVKTDDSALSAYAELFRACFPGASHLDRTYLKWLYADNPDGGVFGFDAYDGHTLAAHYVCIPVSLKLFGRRVSALLSLNTATHPSYQGKGLFTQLAERTYAAAAEAGFDAVYGVANANSTPGFTRKLGFTLVTPLEARLGVGRPMSIQWDKVDEATDFERIWDAERLTWRASNPANAAAILPRKKGYVEAHARTDKPLITAWGVARAELAEAISVGRSAPVATLFLGLFPREARRYGLNADIPQRFRPSPLNFIFRSLRSPAVIPQKDRIICSFLDFDAY